MSALAWALIAAAQTAKATILAEGPASTNTVVNHLEAEPSDAIDLLEYYRTRAGRTGEGFEPYDRQRHFVGWLKQGSSCMTTRDLVLMRDKAPGSTVVFADPRRCKIARGQWKDPYSGQLFTRAQDVQIDHVVPLKGAYESGAYRWSAARRCHYANFLADKSHLRAVSGHENQEKSAKAPDEYLPPNDGFRCKFVASWLRIKAAWGLSMSRTEFRAIEKVFSQRGCDRRLAFISKETLAQNRAATQKPTEACERLSHDG